MVDVKTIKNIAGLLVIAFACVVFQFVQIVTFDRLGIVGILGIFIVPSLIILPTVISVLLSYICHRSKKWIAVTALLTLAFTTAALNAYRVGPGVPPKPYILPSYVENVSLWDHGKVMYLENQGGLSGYLLYVAQRVNIQAKCVVFDEDVERLKQSGKVIELTFKEPVNLNVSHGITLKYVEKVAFVLEGKLAGHVLIKERDMKSYDCWAIKKYGEIDKSWINEIEGAIKGVNYKVEKCSVGFEPKKVVEYDEKTRTLVAYVRVNCCGVNVTVEKDGNAYRIIEKQHGELCRCMCVRKVIIYDVPIGARVEFVSKDGVIKTLTPRVNVAGFCGWSTYGKCSSDEDCVMNGCSGQVCRSRFEEPIVTTCEWFDCYDAKKFNVSCKCVNGACQWVRK